MTMTLRLRAGLLAALALAGCQALAPSTAASPGPSRSPAAVREVTTCFTAAPATWAGAQRASLPTTQFSVMAVTPAGDRAYGLSRTGAGGTAVAALDLASGALTTVAGAPAGLETLAVEPPWLAWVAPISAANPGPGPVQVKNLDTGEQLELGGGALGGPASVVVHAGRVAWAQPTSQPGQPRTAELRVYDLAARSQTVLDSGDVRGPVLAGRYLVWNQAGGGLRAVDAGTLQPAQLPDRVRSQQSVTYLAGAPTELVWSTDELHATAWRIDRDQLSTYTIGDLGNRLQFLTIAAHFLIWFTTIQYAVLDLDTGGGYDVAGGSVVGSEAAIVRTTPLGPIDAKFGAPGTVVSVLPTAGAPGIPACGR
jgi:hypothetical protein